MEETSTENAKISDSGYSNTGSNSQSHTSSETLPKQIAKRKDKGYKKKKFKESSVSFCTGLLLLHDPCSSLSTEPCNPVLERTKEEVAVVELVDATNPGVHNDNVTTGSKAGVDSKTRAMDDFTSHSSDKYYTVISMHDGMVLHATPSLYESLGYPTDWWTGKLFIDFLDPRDKHLLTERIASEIAISRDFHPSGANGRKASIFCRLRRFNICSSNNDQYVPYRINLVVQNFHGDKLTVSQSHVMLLVASFKSVYSAYKENGCFDRYRNSKLMCKSVPEETIIPTVFTTRQTTTCQLSYVDPEVVQYLGYLPQDMIDRSLFDFYYPEDLPLIKEIYKIVINLESKSYKSKPYRFIIQNGCYVVLETEWSSFINPWTKSVEFVVGQHRVRKGPSDPNIFRPPGNRKTELLASISEEVLKDAKIIQKEIVSLLVEDVQKKTPSAVPGCELLTKKKELTSFAQYILQEIKSTAPIKDHMAVDEMSFSEHDSDMLGEISPYHEYFDSMSSTETPPSYNQLNYQDNIERFFNSKIGVTANNKFYDAEEDIHHSSENSSDEMCKNNESGQELKCTFSTNGSGNSGSGEILSSESTNQQSFGSRGETSNTPSNDKLMILTESLLHKHNEDMEKFMFMKHRQQKKDDKKNKASFNDHKVKPEQSIAKCDANNKNTNRLKRSGSQNRDKDNNVKVSKYDNSVKTPQNLGQMLGSINAKVIPTNIDTSSNAIQENTKINAWPSNSVTMPSTTTITQQCLTTTNAYSQGISRFPTLPQMFPVYYLPVPQPRDNLSLNMVSQEHIRPPTSVSQLVPYCLVPVSYIMPSVLYPSLIGPSASNAVMYRSFPSIVPDVAVTTPPLNNIPPAAAPPAVPPPTTAASFDLKRPESPETSIKAEPRSTIATSESSKKICSISRIVSSCVSNEDGCFSTIDESTTTNTKDNYITYDKNNDSSFFSNFLNKSCDSSSNTEQWRTVSSFEHQQQKSKETGVNQTYKTIGMMRKEPPWIEGVQLTSELIYQYQINPKPLHDVLKSDLEFLSQSKQSNLVNDQLGQLFLDIDLEGFSSNLLLEDPGINSVNDDSIDDFQKLGNLDSCLVIAGSLSTGPWSTRQEPDKNLCDL